MSKKIAHSSVHAPPKVPIMPAIIGILTMVFIVAVFNAQFFAAWILTVIPSESSPIDESTLSATYGGGQPRLVIPKLGIDAPVVYGMKSFQESAVQAALQDGIVHFGNSTPPGAKGNTVYVGYSSAHPWAPGGYNFIFLRLNDLNQGDKIYVFVNDVRFIYQVSSKKNVKPNDVSVLEAGTGAKTTLITCTPVGTNASRLIVQADLVEPEPVEDTLVRQTGAPELNDQLIEHRLPGNGYDALQALGARFR